MKKLLSVLLSIIFAFCFLGTVLLGIIRSDFSYSTVTKIASEILKPVSITEPVDDGLFHPGYVKISLAAYDDYSDFDFNSVDLSSVDMANLDINELVETYLKAAGVDVEPEFVAEVLATPEAAEFVDKYIGEIVNYMTGASDQLTIDPDDITKVINKSLDMYEKKSGQVVDRTGLNEAVIENVPVAQTEIKAALDSIKDENAEYFEILKKVEFILSFKFFLICIAVCLFFALIILLINKNIFVWLQYIFMPVFVDGIIIFVIASCAQGMVPGILAMAIEEAGLPKSIYAGIWTYISKVLSHLKICGVVSAICGIALWALGFTLGKKKAV